MDRSFLVTIVVNGILVALFIYLGFGPQRFWKKMLPPSGDIAWGWVWINIGIFVALFLFVLTQIAMHFKTARSLMEPSVGPHGELAQKASPTGFKKELVDQAKEQAARAEAAEAYFDAAEYDFGANLYKDAALNYQKSIDALPTMSAYLNLSASQLYCSDFEKADRTVRAGLAIADGKNNQEFQAVYLLNLGIVHKNWTKLEESLGFYERARKIYKSLGDRSGEVRVLTNVGVVYRIQGKKDDALKSQKDALKIFEDEGIEDPFGQAVINGNLALLYGIKKNIEEAIKHSNNAIQLYKKAGRPVGLGRTINNMGSLLAEVGLLDQAMEHHKKALSIFEEEKIDNLQGQAEALHNIGIVYEEKGDKDKALEFYEKAIKKFRAIKNRSGEATALYSIARIYLAQNRPQEALNNLNSARTILSDTGAHPRLLKIIEDIIIEVKIGLKDQAKYREVLIALKYFEQLEREIAEEKGEFVLFGLFEREQDPGNWIVVASAEWPDWDKDKMFGYFAIKISDLLHGTPYSRMAQQIQLMDPTEPFIDETLKVFGPRRESAPVFIPKVPFGSIKTAYIIAPEQMSIWR